MWKCAIGDNEKWNSKNKTLSQDFVILCNALTLKSLIKEYKVRASYGKLTVKIK